MAMQARIDAVIESALSDKKIVGTVVLVAKDGEIVYSRAAGHADREAAKPIETSAIFRLASVTKPIVAATALALVDKGKLGLDELAREYLPYFKPKISGGAAADITIRQLLTHTAGLAYGVDASTVPADQIYNGGLANTDLDFEENFIRLSAQPLLAAPGTLWSYSIAIDVLGAIIARIETCSLDEAVRRHVTGPLGMTDTGFQVSDLERLAVPYADGGPEPVRMADPQYVPDPDGNMLTFSPSRLFNPKAFQSGGAGMVGTAGDLITFLEAIRTGGAPILTAETAKAALKNQIGSILRPNDPGERFSFLGAVIDDPSLAEEPLPKDAVHWGGIYGHRWFIDPVNGISAAMMTNTAIEGCRGVYPHDIERAVYGV
jgi:CubicO group peptidase (beta-lactamase class C family)